VYVVSKYGYERNVAEIQEGLAADSLFYAVEGEKTYTLVAAEKHQELVEDVFQGGFKTKTEDLALVTVTSPERIEGVPGVIAHMLLLLANRDINVVELMSCWTDTLLVVDRADVAAVMDALTL
jgi:aspartokinase